MDCPEELKFYRFGSNQAEQLPLAGFSSLTQQIALSKQGGDPATFA